MVLKEKISYEAMSARVYDYELVDDNSLSKANYISKKMMKKINHATKGPG